jgi:hemerythrin-like domain-containing protein
MMPGDDMDDPKALRRVLLDEHQRLMEMATRLTDATDRRPDGEGRWLAEVVERLRGFAVALREHFQEEETGAFARSFPMSYPHLADRMEELTAQHPAILAAVDHALATARSVRRDDAAGLHEVKAAVHLMLATLRRHESAENDLVFRAVNDEVGGGD